MTFQLDLRTFADKIEVDLATVRRKVTLDLFAKATRRTPVDTGRLRGAWAVTDGKPSESTTGGISATFSQPFDGSFITNNLPYALKIEFGHSKQAPAGMARVSVAEVAAELESLHVSL